VLKPTRGEPLLSEIKDFSIEHGMLPRFSLVYAVQFGPLKSLPLFGGFWKRLSERVFICSRDTIFEGEVVYVVMDFKWFIDILIVLELYLL
jgi:hypothetical protein